MSNKRRKQVATFTRTRYFGDPVKVSEGIDALCDSVSDTVNLWIDAATYGDPRVPTDHGSPGFEVLEIFPITTPHLDSSGHVVGVTHALTVTYMTAPSRDATTDELPDMVPHTLLPEPCKSDVEFAIANLKSVQILAERLCESASYALTTESQDIRNKGIFTQARNELNAILTALVDVNTGITRREDLMLFELCAQHAQAGVCLG